MGGSGNDTGAAHTSSFALRPHRFPKEMRLRRRAEFLVVQQTGKKFHGRHFLAVIAPRTSSAGVTAPGRIGITVSKKVGKAVIRNRIKRFVREYLRQHDWMPAGMDTVIIAKRGAAELHDYHAVAADLARLGVRVASCG